MASTEAFVNPELIRWARNRNHLDIPAAAQRLKVVEKTLEAWEGGVARPTIKQAQALADRLSVPLGYLFLDSPPTEELPLPDLRTVAGEAPQDASPDFLDLLYDVLRKHQWYREYLQEQGAEPRQFVGSFASNGVAPEIVAANIRDTLQIDSTFRSTISTWEDFLREFIRRAEDRGVVVMRSGIVKNNTRRKLSVTEFRGFAISDPLAPLIFINGNDAKSAQIFTLAHELAHLWTGASGISNPDYRKRTFEQGSDVERISDRIAAEVVVPRGEFATLWDETRPVMLNLQRLATSFKISRWVVLRQAYDLGELSTEEYNDHYDLLSREGRSQGSQSRGGTFYPTFFLRNSATLTNALITSVSEGSVLHRDAARLLSVKVKTLDGIAEHALGVPTGSG